MDFFGMGIGEILLILVIVLIIWGPGKLPEIARTLGKTIRALRKASLDLTTQISKELDTEEKASPSQPRASSGDKTKKLSDVVIAKKGPPSQVGASSGDKTEKSLDVGMAEPRDGEVTSQKD